MQDQDRLLPVATWMTVGSLTVSGILGALIMEALGPPLARAAAIWTLRTTEPADPQGSYPWWAFCLCLAMVGWGWWQTRRAAAPSQGPLRAFGVALAGSIGLALLPIIYLYMLWGRT